MWRRVSAARETAKQDAQKRSNHADGPSRPPLYWSTGGDRSGTDEDAARREDKGFLAAPVCISTDPPKWLDGDTIGGTDEKRIRPPTVGRLLL